MFHTYPSIMDTEMTTTADTSSVDSSTIASWPDDEVGQSSFSTTAIIFRSVYITFASILTIFGNIFAMFVLHRVPEFSDATKIFMTALCSADLGVGFAITLSIPASFIDDWPFGTIVCQIFCVLIGVFGCSSVAYLVGITLDRFVATSFPLRYPSLLTRSRAIKASTLIGIVTLCVNILLLVFVSPNSLSYNHHAAICIPQPISTNLVSETIYFVLILVLPMAAIFTIYSKLLYISHKQVRRIRQDLPAAGRVKTDDRKAVILFIVVTASFTASWLPFFVSRMHVVITTVTYPGWADFVIIWLAMSNSWFNFCIYILMSRPFRRTALRLLNASPFFHTTVHPLPD